MIGKNDAPKNNQNQQQSDNKPKEPSNPAEPLSPVEKQELAQAQAPLVLHQALSKGRDPIISEGLIGELEKAITEAESKGEHTIASELHSVLTKFGALKHALVSIEKDAASHVKPLYAKLIKLFK